MFICIYMYLNPSAVQLMKNEMALIQEFSEYISVADEQIVKLRAELNHLREENATYVN
jgi:hypothetical protein